MNKVKKIKDITSMNKYGFVMNKKDIPILGGVINTTGKPLKLEMKEEKWK